MSVTSASRPLCTTSILLNRAVVFVESNRMLFVVRAVCFAAMNDQSPRAENSGTIRIISYERGSVVLLVVKRSAHIILTAVAL